MTVGRLLRLVLLIVLLSVSVVTGFVHQHNPWRSRSIPSDMVHSMDRSYFLKASYLHSTQRIALLKASSAMDDSNGEEPKPKKRGRKAKSDATSAKASSSTDDSTKKKRGRPKKSDIPKPAIPVSDIKPRDINLDGLELDEELTKLFSEDAFKDIDFSDLESLDPSKLNVKLPATFAGDELSLDIDDAELEQALADIESGDLNMFDFLGDPNKDEGKEAPTDKIPVAARADEAAGEAAPALLGGSSDDDLAALLADFSLPDFNELSATNMDNASDTDFSIKSALVEGLDNADKPKKGRKKKEQESVDAIMSSNTDVPTTTSVNGTNQNVVIDGVEIKGDEFSLGDIETPPLEDFKKLMESLEGQDSMFEDDDIGSDLPQGTNIRATGAGVFDMDEIDPSGKKWHPESSDEVGWTKISATADIAARKKWPSNTLKPWIGNTYEGNKPYRHKYEETHKEPNPELQEWNNGKDHPKFWRCTIITVFTHGQTLDGNNAYETAWKVIEHIQEATKVQTEDGSWVKDDRIAYQTWLVQQKNEMLKDGPSWHDTNKELLQNMKNVPNPEFNGGSAVEELEGRIQMYVEGYNTYHLIDGHAMKEAWGGIKDDIILSPKNLQAIVDQIKWALKEDTLGGALLSPRMRRVRARGGAAEMITGYNTEFLDTEFSVVSVR